MKQVVSIVNKVCMQKVAYAVLVYVKGKTRI